MDKFLPYHLRELFYTISALRIFPSSRLANTIASANAAASAIGPAYITPSIPINNGKIMIVSKFIISFLLSKPDQICTVLGDHHIFAESTDTQHILDWLAVFSLECFLTV